MNHKLFLIGICASTFLVGPGIVVAQDDIEEAQIKESNPEFLNSGDTVIASLEANELQNQMVTTGFGSMSSDDFNALLQKIKLAHPIEGVNNGNAGQDYDVILQPGHYYRSVGKTGAQGEKVSEKDLVAFIVKTAAESLNDSGLKVLVVPADGVNSNLKTKVFVAVHADGTVNQCRIGPSMAYSDKSSMLAMHAVGLGLATAFGYDYEDFMNDNYTVDSARYYMFSKIDASRMSGLLEVGELSCPAIEDRLIEASESIGKNLAVSLKYIATLESTP